MHIPSHPILPGKRQADGVSHPAAAMTQDSQSQRASRTSTQPSVTRTGNVATAS